MKAAAPCDSTLFHSPQSTPSDLPPRKTLHLLKSGDHFSSDKRKKRTAKHNSDFLGSKTANTHTHTHTRMHKGTHTTHVHILWPLQNNYQSQELHLRTTPAQITLHCWDKREENRQTMCLHKETPEKGWAFPCKPWERGLGEQVLTIWWRFIKLLGLNVFQI